MNYFEFKDKIKKLSTDELRNTLATIEYKIEKKDYVNIEDILDSRDEIKNEIKRRENILQK